MIKSADVLLRPSPLHITEIEAWLKEEDKKSHKGFFCSWPVIQSAYMTGRIAVITVEGKAIGFMTWQISGQVAEIDITEIHPLFRKQGYGKFLLENACRHFLAQRVFVVELQCEPPISEKAWRKMGFVSYPTHPTFNYYNEKGNIHLYKPLINIAKTLLVPCKGTIIELWDKEIHLTANEEPVWSWCIEFMQGSHTLVAPVIWPCYDDWRIRIREGNKIIKDGKVKCLSDERVVHDKFLILQDIFKSM